MSNLQLAISIAAVAAATQLTRFLPFLIFPASKKVPAFVTFLGKTLPYAAMGMLLIYCFKDVSFSAPKGYLPTFIAVLVTAGLHLWRKNTLLSIGTGTVIYMLLLQFVF